MKMDGVNVTRTRNQRWANTSRSSGRWIHKPNNKDQIIFRRIGFLIQFNYWKIDLHSTKNVPLQYGRINILAIENHFDTISRKRPSLKSHHQWNEKKTAQPIRIVSASWKIIIYWTDRRKQRGGRIFVAFTIGFGRLLYARPLPTQQKDFPSHFASARKSMNFVFFIVNLRDFT